MGIQFTNTKDALNKMETLFASTRCALDKIDDINNNLNKSGNFGSLSFEDRVIISKPMMYLAAVIADENPYLGCDLYHALHAIYYREEEKQLWKK